MDRRGRHDHTSDEALTSTDLGIRCVRVSFGTLAVTVAIQAAIVALSGSVALLADTIHNLSDALTAVPLWIAFRLGRRPPTRRYPYGYHRAEDLAGIAIVAVIAASAALAGWEGLRGIADPRELRNAGLVIAAGFVGFAGNELVARYRIRVGREIGSGALVADGQHARTDGLTSLGVVLGAAGTLAGFERADPIVGLAITVTVLLVLRSAARTVVRRAMDGVEEPITALLEGVASGVGGVEHVTGVRARWAGHALSAELSIDVDEALSVGEGHAIAEEVRHRLLHDVPRVRSVTVHVDPHRHGGPDPHGATLHHEEAQPPRRGSAEGRP